MIYARGRKRQVGSCKDIKNMIMKFDIFCKTKYEVPMPNTGTLHVTLSYTDLEYFLISLRRKRKSSQSCRMRAQGLRGLSVLGVHPSAAHSVIHPDSDGTATLCGSSVDPQTASTIACHARVLSPVLKGSWGFTQHPVLALLPQLP